MTRWPWLTCSGLCTSTPQNKHLPNTLHNCSQDSSFGAIFFFFAKKILYFPFLLADEFKDIVHSLDIWHKSKNIRKCLIQVWILALVLEVSKSVVTNWMLTWFDCKAFFIMHFFPGVTKAVETDGQLVSIFFSCKPKSYLKHSISKGWKCTTTILYGFILLIEICIFHLDWEDKRQRENSSLDRSYHKPLLVLLC